MNNTVLIIVLAVFALFTTSNTVGAAQPAFYEWNVNDSPESDRDAIIVAMRARHMN
jgi:hypothetical protein